MAYARARKHYRVTGEKAKQSYSRGLFIPNGQKPLIGGVLAVFVIIVFVKGLIFGMLIGRNMD